MPRPLRPRRLPDAATLDPVLSSQIADLRALLAALEALPLAALLRELGVVLYNRDILQWRVLVDVSDELLDAAEAAARARLTERWLRKPPVRMKDGSR